MTHYTPNLIDIVTHTPTWVWLLLSLLIWRGLMSTRERTTNLRALLLMPVILSTLSALGIISGGLSLAALAGVLIGAAGGVAAGRWLEERRPARIVVPGQLLLPGEWTTMATVMVNFTTHYTTSVMAAVAPDQLANPMVHTISVGISGFFAATLLTRMGLRLALLRSPALAA